MPPTLPLLQGFDRLSVQTCKEVVSMGLPLPPLAPDGSSGCGAADADADAGAAGPLLPAGARHVEPQEFHAMLAEAEAAAAVGGAAASTGCDTASSSSGSSTKETVLVDARNLYETRIGHFEAVSWPSLPQPPALLSIQHMRAHPTHTYTAPVFPTLPSSVTLPSSHPACLCRSGWRCWTLRCAASQTPPPG